MHWIPHHITNSLQVGVKSPTMVIKRIHHNFSPDFLSAGISVGLPYILIKPTIHVH